MTIEHVRLTDEENAKIKKAINDASQMARGFPEIIPDNTAGAIFLIFLCQKIIQNNQPHPSIFSPDPGYEREKILIKTRTPLEILSQINNDHLETLKGQYPGKENAIYQLVGELRILASQLYQDHKDEKRVEELKQEWRPRLTASFTAFSNSTAPSGLQEPGGQ